MYTQPYEFINNSKIISGNRALENIPMELKSYNSRRPFVVTSRETGGPSLRKKFVNAFSDSHTTIGCFFNDTPALTDTVFIDELAGLFRERNCDSIIALGSGAVVNTAKALNVFLSSGGKFLSQTSCYSEPKLPFFLVPVSTTTGTDISKPVIINEEKITTCSVFPDLICIDRRMAGGATAPEALDIGLTALTHAVESSIISTNPMTDAYAGSTLSMIDDTLALIVKGRARAKDLIKFQNGVIFSGIALANSGPGTANILGETLSEITGKPAGLLKGLLLAPVIRHLDEDQYIKSRELLMPLAGMDIYARTSPEQRTPAVISRIKKIYRSIRKTMPENLAEAGVSEDSAELCAKAASEKADFSLTADDCRRILSDAMKEQR